MNVEETKTLILRRLDELRDVRVDSHVGQSQRPVTRPGEARPKRWGHNWFRETTHGGDALDLTHRLRELEQRMNSIERCFIEAPTESQRREAVAMLGQVKATLGSSTPSPIEASQPAADSPFEGLPYQLTGTAEDGMMTDVLQLLGANRKTGRFSLYVDDPKERFDVFFRDGRLCHAQVGDVEGEAAFFRLMVAGHRAGRYGFLEGDESGDSSETISAKTEFLILEALRRIDEEQQSETGPQTPDR